MASLKKRGKTYYAQYYVNGKQKRVNLDTTSLQIAKEKVRQIESAQLRQDDIPIPTKTPLSEIIEKYVYYLRGKTAESNVQKIVSYLRGSFGPVCNCLKIKNENIAKKAVKRPPSKTLGLLEIGYVEHLTTMQVSRFLTDLIMLKGISAKTINHYRQIILTMCNWAMTEGGVKFPGGKNPVMDVTCYKEVNNDIRYLKLSDIDEQLEKLSGNPMIQTMVALFIYAGLRREEALWLMPSDLDWDAGNHGTIRICVKAFDGKKWVPKTGSRTVPISSDLRRYLDRYRENLTQGVWLFTSPQGCRWDKNNFSRELRAANEESGLKWNCLDFRHTFGSHLASKGESLYKISKLMGNSPQICQKHYAALMPESLYESVEFCKPTIPPAPQPDTPAPPPAALPVTSEPPRLRLVVNNR